MSTQIILLERIEHLGAMGEIVHVKPGYARNFLLPQNKALRATKSNIAYFEAQKAVLEKANNEKKAAAEKHAKTLEGMTIAIIRQAGEGGQLYGSVTARDIADEINQVAKEKIERNMVDLNQNFKDIGLFPVTLTLHPEVKVDVTVNIARTADEAAKQLKTGKAIISDELEDNSVQTEEATEASKADLMEADALEAEKTAEAEAEAKAQADAEKSAAKAEAKAAKKVAEPEEEEGAEISAETEAPADESTEEKA